MKSILGILLLYFFTLPVLAENTILIVGDSVSAAYGIEPSQGWPVLLQKRLKDAKYDYTVQNASVTGDTTSDALARLPAALEKYHPQITIIELGNNDGLRGLQIPLIKGNLSRIITMAKEAKSKVLVLGGQLPPNYGAVYIQQFHQIYIELAKRTDIQVVPFFFKGLGQDPKLIQADGVHPTAAGQPIMLNNMWPGLIPLLK